MTEKSAPGPIGTSCLTCKRSHRKCDMRQPVCLTCEQGGFECLGYSHNRRGVARLAPLKALKLRRILPKEQGGNTISPARLASVSSRSNSSRADSCSGKSSSLEVEVRFQAKSGSNSLFDGSSQQSEIWELSLEPGIDIQRRHHNMRSATTDGYLQSFSPSLYERQAPIKPPSLNQLYRIFSRLPLSPSDPIMGYLNSPELVAYVSSSFNRALDSAYFKPMKDQSEQLNAMLISRLRGSRFTRWVVLLSVKICEDMVDGNQSLTEHHVRWIEDIEGAVQQRLSQDPTPREAAELHGDRISVSLLKSMFGRHSNAYMVLRSSTPAFLQTAYSIPDLWSGCSDHTLIPLLNIIGSENHALSIFALMDCTCAMAFGLPQQVEYDTGTGPLPKQFLPHEWAHSVPTEFHILLADINACRDQSIGARGWEEIEYVLVNWQAQVSQPGENWESWMIVAWLAVQESWRLALRAYLYLAVCGCSSDDARIQECVAQILQVLSTVKKHEDPDIKLPFIVQYLMAGICARSEKHRKISRSKLADLMPLGKDFVPVLDNLWHGAGSGGRPITWDDYISSREAILPVPI